MLQTLAGSAEGEHILEGHLREDDLVAGADLTSDAALELHSEVGAHVPECLEDLEALLEVRKGICWRFWSDRAKRSLPTFLLSLPFLSAWARCSCLRRHM